ncbi:C2H2 domain-containing protein [Periconia macrospinosa]|uniref:C2H2 domain-containing protein n=1 Tax=Periconia macrospinosa TaxID=97972 RepID=A0A2V1EAS5_9PLEO|nr:C2H2 domain-containing protein [Periconia macrospinosa]
MTSPNANLSSGCSQSTHSSGTTTPNVAVGVGHSQRSRVSTGFSSQQSTLVGTGPPHKNGALQAAVLKFKNKLPPQQLVGFKDVTYDDLRDQIMKIQNDQEHNMKIMNLSRIQSCLEAMHQFGKVIEVFLNISDVIAFVWGPMKFLLLTASNFADSFEILLDAYEQIGEQLPLLQEYEALFWDNPYMVEVLELMYMDILDFHQHALKFFSGKQWRRFFQCRANISQYQRYKEDMKTLQDKTQELIAKEDAKNLSAVKEWLAVGSQPQLDHKGYQEIRKEYPGTGHWINKHEQVQEWLDTAVVPPTCVLWLNAIPGAGKTILASNIVEECKSRTEFKTAYFYCHHEDQTANTSVAVLKALVDQLLDEYPDLFLPPCHSKQASSGEPILRTFPLALSILEYICATVPRLFLVIDGIDECEQNDRKLLLDSLIKIASEADNDEPGRLRLLVVSQEYPDIRKALNSSSVARVRPNIVSLSETDNEGDIKVYVREWVDKITEKHGPFDEDGKQYLRNLTVSRAKGMFLYAKLVMENFYKQPTRELLINAIQKRNFPAGLKEALLGWMICWKRQLTWKEIQVALSIDVENNSIEWDGRRLRTHIHDICGSLVKVNGERVSLVHSTAKQYITECIEDIHRPSVECELATLCLEYLVFPCFDDDVDKQNLREWMIEGHFAFQDYAVAKWFYHLNAFVETGRDLLEGEKAAPGLLSEISSAMVMFLTRYNDEEDDFYEDIVDECRSKCEAFRDQDFYEDLVALQSHIYKVQTKGFNARHKISIDKLEKALMRNRELLESLPPKLSAEEYARFCQFYDGVRRFKCTRITCLYFSEGFKEAKSRKRHVNIHDRPFQCEVPDCLGANGFANSKDLEKHTRAFHPDISDLAERFNAITTKKTKTDHTCTICGKSFTRKQIMVDHIRSHRGERPHECEECGKAFTRKNDKTRHAKIHAR